MAIIVAWADWYGITFFVISVTMAIVAIAYMFGIGFHLPKLQGWAKEEFFQALASALIAVLLISFSLTIDNSIKSLYGGRDPFKVASDYVTDMVMNLSGYFLSVVYMDVGIALLQSMAFKAMPSQMGFSISPFAGFTVLTALLSLMMEGILGGMGIMIGQGTFLMFIHKQFLILLPVGIALRAFPFSRSAGGALIAVFIGFYIFYPFLWVFDSQVYREISNLNYINPNLSANAQGLGSACAQDTVKCTTNTPDFGSNMILALIKDVGYNAVYYLFVFVFIMSLFNLLTVLVLTNELAKIFGAEIDLGGLSGLI
jgi:hypothetical protein